MTNHLGIIFILLTVGSLKAAPVAEEYGALVEKMKSLEVNV